jgi:hypothetical protein
MIASHDSAPSRACRKHGKCPSALTIGSSLFSLSSSCYQDTVEIVKGRVRHVRETVSLKAHRNQRKLACGCNVDSKVPVSGNR